jgi:hypothetical protein
MTHAIINWLIIDLVNGKLVSGVKTADQTAPVVK